MDTYIKMIARKLLLADWTIEFTAGELPDSGNKADISWTEGTKTAHLRVHPEHYDAHTVIHELLHLHHAPLETCQTLEVMVDQLAKVLYPFLPHYTGETK